MKNATNSFGDYIGNFSAPLIYIFTGIAIAIVFICLYIEVRGDKEDEKDKKDMKYGKNTKDKKDKKNKT